MLPSNDTVQKFSSNRIFQSCLCAVVKLVSFNILLLLLLLLLFDDSTFQRVHFLSIFFFFVVVFGPKNGTYFSNFLFNSASENWFLFIIFGLKKTPFPVNRLRRPKIPAIEKNYNQQNFNPFKKLAFRPFFLGFFQLFFNRMSMLLFSS